MANDETNSKRQELQRERRRRYEVQLKEDVRRVMATPEGRRFAWWLLDEVAGVDNGTFAGEETHASAYAEGRRAVGREVRAALQAEAGAAYLLMLQDILETRLREASAEAALEEREAQE